MTTQLEYPELTVTPAGPISRNIEALRQSIANSATFQSITDAPDATAALDHVWGSLGPEDADDDEIDADVMIAMRPRVSIFVPPGALSLNRNATQSFGVSLSLHFRYEENIAEEFEGHPLDLEYDFYNRIGELVKEVKKNSGRSPYPDIKSLTLETPISRAAKVEVDRMGDFLYCVFQVAIGGRS